MVSAVASISTKIFPEILAVGAIEQHLLRQKLRPHEAFQGFQQFLLG